MDLIIVPSQFRQTQTIGKAVEDEECQVVPCQQSGGRRGVSSGFLLRGERVLCTEY